MRRAIFTRKFSAAHRLWGDDSICRRIHGHNYRVSIMVVVERLHHGMVVHADRIKEVVDQQYDHRLILSKSDPLDLVFSRDSLEQVGLDWIVRIEGSPTTEILAERIARDVSVLVNEGQGHGYVEVVLYETDTIHAVERVEW
jgi:6-pyruvoyl-tetrahydropterin synthase